MTSKDDYAFFFIRTENIILSFNGGKDCTVVLHLLFAVLNMVTGSVGTLKHPRLFYVRAQTPFPEVETFVQSVLVFYKYQSSNVTQMGGSSTDAKMRPLSNLIVYDGTIKEGLMRLKQDSPNLKAVFVGTRFVDPRTGEQRLPKVFIMPILSECVFTSGKVSLYGFGTLGLNAW